MMLVVQDCLPQQKKANKELCEKRIISVGLILLRLVCWSVMPPEHQLVMRLRSQALPQSSSSLAQLRLLPHARLQ